MGIFNSDRRATRGSTATTLIAKGCAISGELKVESDVQIDGFVSGQLHVAGTLIVSESGHATGDIFAKKLIVNGVIDGNCHAEQIQVLAKGRVDGKIWSNNLSIDPGGKFFGETAELVVKETAAPKNKASESELNEPKNTTRKSA